MKKPASKSAPQGKVTLTEVAEKAGVSVMTASRALSGEGYVSDKTREKVMAAAGKLGYTPNISARVMRGGRTNVVGLLVNDLNSTVLNMIAGEITTLVRKAGMDLLIYNSVEDLGTRHGNGVNILKSVCDGLLMVMPRLSEGYITTLENIQVPIVLVNYWHGDTRLPIVRADNYHGAREAMRHLLELGHKRIGFIAGSAYSGQSGERQRGYTDGLAEYGIAVDAKLIAQGSFGRVSGMEAGRKLLSLSNPPTAIFSANDEMAFGVMDAARARGLQLPQDLSIIGFDDIEASAHIHPALTTVRQPFERLAEAAVQELVGRLGQDGAQHSTIELPSQFILRESTAAPAKATRKKA